MLPQPNPPFIPNPDDAELEWLLCLAAAIQAREQERVKFAAECQLPPEPTLRSRLQALLKGLRGAERIRAA